MTYRPLSTGEHFIVDDARRTGRVDVCDAVDHNDPGGCSRRSCFKHAPGLRFPSRYVGQVFQYSRTVYVIGHLVHDEYSNTMLYRIPVLWADGTDRTPTPEDR